MNSKNTLALLIGLFVSSCISDLDVDIKDPNQIIGKDAYKSIDDYTSGIAKVYAGLTLTGQTGPHGDGDIGGIDEGMSQYFRGYWQLQELPTDEAKITYRDGTLQTFNFQTWSSSSEIINATYSRFLYLVELANQFLRDSSNDRLNDLELTDNDIKLIEKYRVEARWLRALGYYHSLDFFGNIPFKSEDDPAGGFLPPQYTQEQLFDFIQSELEEIAPKMTAPRENEYGRVDRAAAWALLAKLNLNAEVYINKPRYEEVVKYSEKIMNTSYSLANNYKDLFLADNNQGDALNEIIFSIPNDANHTQSDGGTSYIISASIGGKVKPADIGAPKAKKALRATKNLLYLFAPDGDLSKVSDKRGEEYKNGEGILLIEGQNMEMDDVLDFSGGVGVLKFKNMNSDGSPGEFGENKAKMMNVDFPLFRLGDVYLMWTEAKMKLGEQNATYINKLRDRALAEHIENTDIDDDFILDERGRELYWEGTRRTDLVRFGKFTGGNYIWQWKGETSDGVATDEMFNLYPIPISDLIANPNLKQNPNY